MARYIDKNVYLEKRGINLDYEFQNVATDNPDNVVNLVLDEIEDFVLEYMAQHFETPKTEYDPVVMQKVMIYQVDYFRRNGNLTMDSDYHGEGLAPNAYRVLFNNGYANPVTQGANSFRGLYGNKYLR